MSSNVDHMESGLKSIAKAIRGQLNGQLELRNKPKKQNIYWITGVSLLLGCLAVSPVHADEIYLVGDWDGDGRDNLAIRRGSRILMDTDFNSVHNIEQMYGYGDSEDQYLVGDWDGDGRDNIAVRRGNHILMDTNFDSRHDREIVFGNGNSEDEYFVIKNVVTGIDSVSFRRGNHIYIYRGDNIPPDETWYGTGNSEDQYMPADWQGQGYDQLAVRRGNKVLIDFDFNGRHDWTLVYGYGNAEDEYLVGDWDGDGKDNLAVRRGNHILMDTNFNSTHDIEQVYGYLEPPSEEDDVQPPIDVPDPVEEEDPVDVPGLPDSYPDASTTGVPDGTVLIASETLEITEPGTVIDGYLVNGIILVHASNVTVRNTRIVGTGFWSILVDDGLTGVRVEDSEIAGQETTSGTEGSNGIMGPVTVMRCDISGVENGITPGTGSVISYNYIHDLGAPGDDPHIDGIQIDGNISDVTIDHNRIISKDTSAIMIDNYFGPISNIVVSKNYLAGGAYTVYSDGQFDGGQIKGVQFTDNRMEKGLFGYASIEDNTVVDIGNVDAITGEPITLQ